MYIRKRICIIKKSGNKDFQNAGGNEKQKGQWKNDGSGKWRGVKLEREILRK